MQRLLDRLCRIFDHLIATLLAAMVILVFGNVVLRYGFDSGITLSEELARWLFVWTTFLGAAIALREHQHLGTEFLTRRLGRTGRKLCAALSRAAMLLCCVLLAIGAGHQAMINLDSRSAVMEASLAWLDSAVLVFAVFGGLILLFGFRARDGDSTASVEPAVAGTAGSAERAGPTEAPNRGAP